VAVERIDYQAGSVAGKGALIWNEKVSGRRPLLLVMTNWLGVTENAIKRAQKMAGDKYIAFVGCTNFSTSPRAWEIANRYLSRGCADVPSFLRPRRERPGNLGTTNKRYELSPPHSITSSARARSDGGTVRPSTVAVVRLITRSNLVGCSTGISPGFVPRRILSTYSAARRNMCGMLGP